MFLKSIISRSCIKVDSSAKDKEELLHEIAKLSKQSNVLDNISEDKIYNALSEREKVGTTGFGNEIAIPHCKLDNIDQFVVGAIINKKGIDFNAVDNKKTKIFFFIIAPEKEKNKHIQILSAVSRFLQSSQNKKDILKSDNTDDFISLFQTGDDDKNKQIGHDSKVMFHIFIQKEKYFNSILQIFSEVSDGSISVIETENAGHYLHNMPLFSTFWSDDTKLSCKVLIAVIDKNYSNDVIRRINTEVTDIEKKSGVLMTVSELYYTNGSIDF